MPRPPKNFGDDGEAILSELGYSAVEVAAMREQGAVL
jgi:crotonobetainyl-CoA:carnitine CoA-transferase CaiB-like acyl-CoA transferase